MMRATAIFLQIKYACEVILTSVCTLKEVQKDFAVLIIFLPLRSQIKVLSLIRIWE